MGHGLPGVRAGVEDDPVSAAVDPLGHRDLVSLGRHFGQQPVTRRRERGQVRIVIFRYDKNMRRCLRAYVAERNGS